MNKPVFGLLLGGFLGIFDGLSALVSAPETRPEIVGLAFAYWVAHMQETELGRNYYWQIMTPGGLLGVIVGFATQRYTPRTAA